jgi:1-deoxy-D-xylulose-5-phosphate reductoisomerase
MEFGGTKACALNASNEIAVDAFLKEKIGFLDLARINAATMEQTGFIAKPSYEDYVAVDAEARRIAASLCQ